MADNTYSRGKIYMIESASTGLIYYGSTCNELYKRIGMHRNDYKRFQAGKYRRTTSFDVLQHPDARILLVEAFPCANKQELNAREAHYIRNNDCVNKNIPGRTDVEYYQENKEEILEKMKQYRQENKEMIMEKRKKLKHCETCSCSVRSVGFSVHRKTKKHITNTSNQPLPGVPPGASDGEGTKTPTMRVTNDQ